jgi:hypothetical protein
MVRTRATASGANNPCNKVEGTSHQHTAEMEARIAQMSRDMEVLTQQNISLQRWLADERVPEVLGGHEEGESNTHKEEDRESRRLTERTQPENRSQRVEGAVNPSPSEGMVNHHYEERRLNEAIAMLDEKYEEKYNQLQLEIQQKTKGKISRVDSLLNRSSPFTECIMVVQLPKKFKISAIQTYTGVEDPTEHLDNYKAHMDLQGTPQELACRAFPAHLVRFCSGLVLKTPTGFHHEF